jgi:hypothetical protein
VNPFDVLDLSEEDDSEEAYNTDNAIVNQMNIFWSLEYGDEDE